MAKRRILLVEDDEGNALVISTMCRLGGYDVLWADSGLSALALLSRERVDLVLFDVRMPHVDGPGTLRVLRARAEWAAMPVVFLSAGLAPGDRERLSSLGAQAVLGKPVRRADLLGCLAQTLASA